MTTSPCPSCDGAKGPRIYLCRGCWFTLTQRTRRALSRRDAKAVGRLLELHRQLQNGVPLHEIEVMR